MIVVIKLLIGEILVIVQNVGVDVDGLVVIIGLYLFGLIFKMIIVGVVVECDLVIFEMLLGCFGEIDIGYCIIFNYGGFDLGVVLMLCVFVSFCNIIFVELSSRLFFCGLIQVVWWYGIGFDYQVDGIIMVIGLVLLMVDLVECIEDGFGQGKVLVSLFGMVLVVVMVVVGKILVLQLIVGWLMVVEGDVILISQKMIDVLWFMMWLVVINGIVKEIVGCGEVFGKIGEVEFLGGLYFWFVGYCGDLVFVLLIVGGGSLEYVVWMIKVMFELLLLGYLVQCGLFFFVCMMICCQGCIIVDVCVYMDVL